MGHYDDQREEDARKVAEMERKRQKKCNHFFQPFRTDSIGKIIQIRCVSCSLIKDVNR